MSLKLSLLMVLALPTLANANCYISADFSVRNREPDVDFILASENGRVLDTQSSRQAIIASGRNFQQRKLCTQVVEKFGDCEIGIPLYYQDPFSFFVDSYTHLEGFPTNIANELFKTYPQALSVAQKMEKMGACRKIVSAQYRCSTSQYLRGDNTLGHSLDLNGDSKFTGSKDEVNSKFVELIQNGFCESKYQATITTKKPAPFLMIRTERMRSTYFLSMKAMASTIPWPPEQLIARWASLRSFSRSAKPRLITSCVRKLKCPNSALKTSKVHSAST